MPAKILSLAEARSQGVSGDTPHGFSRGDVLLMVGLLGAGIAVWSAVGVWIARWL